jgi:NAD-dependent DNA ligase
MDISFLKEGIIKKAYKSGCDSILKILTLNSKTLMDYDIEGVKDKTANKIVKSIQTSVSQSTLGDISAATPYFNSMAKKRMNIIDSSIENWLNIPEAELLSAIENLSGFSRKTADVVVAGRNDFKEFYTELNKHNIVISKKTSKQDEPTINTKSDIHISKIFLFTGFRDEKLKNTILENGGNVKDTLSKKITHLVIPEDGFTNSKVEKAIEMGTQVVIKTDSMFH